ncbi:disulfide bond formation protein B 1 [Azospira sp. I13]|uniref:disulfide bond formation protein B n=1 Tax=Azospira sp. I13 TaxID=1765050 RepID=UPI000D44F17A|nr:disulfide bond formation protein B [Azospira sp. I13]GBG03855.1 disulfide bond formation protein B 1 [Azospira sp. I13]
MPFLNRLAGRPGYLLLAVGCISLVSAGLVIQEMERLQPCPLCIFQRVLYMLVAVLALGGLAWPKGRGLWLGLIALTALGGMATAVYQTWLQWVADPALECAYGDPNAIERLVDWLGMQYPPLFMATGFCSARDWTFLQLSMANWSILCFGGVLVGLPVIARRPASI